MRPLPRVHAITDSAVLSLQDFGVRAAAIAAAGPAVALHARDRTATGARLTAVTQRLLALSHSPEASVFVNGRPDIAAALDTQGVQLGADDLSPPDARAVLGPEWAGWIGCSVHSAAEARMARDSGADFLIAGAAFESSTHLGRPPAGLELIREAAQVGLPVIAIGGITAERAMLALQAGAYGVAAIRAVWYAPDPASATLALLEPWMDET